MGRELKRKQAKREGKNVREAQKKNRDKPLSMRTFIIILIVLLVFFVLLYLLTGIFITKDIKWFNKDNETEEDTQNIEDRILAVDSLRQYDHEYYVYYYDPSEEKSEVTNITYTLTSYVYRVDLSDDFNSNFVGEPSGIVENINDLKVANPTIIKVNDGKISAFYSGTLEITTALGEE